MTTEPADPGRTHGRGAATGTRPNLAVLARLWPFLRPYSTRLLLAAAALIVAAATLLGLGQALRTLVDEGFVAGRPELLDQALLALLLVVGVMTAATYVRFYNVSWLGERVVTNLRRRVFDHLLTLEVGYFEGERAGALVSRLTTDAAILETVVGSSVSVALRNVLTLVGGLILVAITSPRLTLLVLLVVPPVLVTVVALGRRVRRLSREGQDRVGDVGALIDESLHGVATLQAFTREPETQARFAAAAEASFVAARRRIRARATLTAIVIALVFSAVALILWTGGRDVVAGTLTAGQLSAFVFYAAIVAGAAGALAEVAGDLSRAAGATDRLFAILDRRPEIRSPARPRPLPVPGQGRVTLRGVSFRYPTRPDRAALHDVTVQIRPGERVALVGPSGAGKSTLFSLLLRYHDPSAGVIELDGVDLREADPRDVRARIGVVAQSAPIFATSVAENLRLGDPHADDAALAAAAEAANALGFIRALPQGFETQLGERGVRLSGGERQRIAIARALLRDPRLLLLDEATSALDADSERAVQGALDRLMVGRTSLVIAHRLATVRTCDRILVLDGGRIVAEGRHGELIAAGGLYARLAALQFLDCQTQTSPPMAEEKSFAADAVRAVTET